MAAPYTQEAKAFKEERIAQVKVVKRATRLFPGAEETNNLFYAICFLLVSYVDQVLLGVLETMLESEC